MIFKHHNLIFSIVIDAAATWKETSVNLLYMRRVVKRSRQLNTLIIQFLITREPQTIAVILSINISPPIMIITTYRILYVYM